MKTYLINILFLFLLCIPATQAQVESTVASNNYVVLTKKMQQLTPIAHTVQALKDEDGEAFGNFQVVVCGQTVQEFENLPGVRPFLDQVKQAGGQVVVCGFSLNKFGVDPSSIPKDVEIVENGIFYSFQLQKQGYFLLSI